MATSLYSTVVEVWKNNNKWGNFQRQNIRVLSWVTSLQKGALKTHQAHAENLCFRVYLPEIQK